MSLQRLFETLGPFSYFALTCIALLIFGLLIGWLLWWARSKRYAKAASDLEIVKEEVNQLTLQNQQLSSKVNQSYQTSSTSGSIAFQTPDNQELPEASPQSLTGVRLASIEGVSPEAAKELESMGVHNLAQLDAMPQDARRELESKLSGSGQAWDWNWLEEWKGKAGVGQAGIGAAGLGAAGIGSFASDQGKAQSGSNNLASGENDHGDSGRDHVASYDQADGSGAFSGASGGSGGDGTAMRDHDDNATLNLPTVDGPSVDWHGIEGIDPRVAGQLEQLGIQNIEQLEALSPEDREIIEAKLSFDETKWDWGWLGQWKENQTHVAQAHRADGSDPQGEVGQHGEADPQTDSNGESFGDSHGSFAHQDHHRQPLSVDGGLAESRVDPRADSSTDVLNLRSSDSPAVRWDSVDGVDPALASEFSSLGISNCDQLQQLSASQSQKLESHLAQKGISWNWNWINQWKDQVASNPDSLLDTSSTGSDSRSSDDPTSLESSSLESSGGSAKHSASADGSGWMFGARNLFGRRTASSDEGNVASTGSTGRSDTSTSGPQSVGSVSDSSTAANPIEDRSGDTRVLGFSAAHPRSDLASSGDPAYGGDPASGGDQASDGGWASADGQVSRDQTIEDSPGTLPKFDLGIPRVKDDLTLLDGIDSQQAEALHQMGIHDFDHLHDLSPTNRDRLRRYFQHRGWHLDMDQWRIASEGNTEDPTMEDIQQKAYDVYQYREQHGLGGWEKTDWDQAEWELRGNPSFGYGVPHHVDDFCETAKITPAAKEELYRMGLYNHGQIDALDPDARKLLTRWFAGPRFGVDMTSAFNWLSTLESVPERNFGETHLNRPDHVDDLTEINGVGPSTERELNRIGIFQYRQIAGWDEEIVQSISQTLDLHDRIEKDLWVVQAQRLSQMS